MKRNIALIGTGGSGSIHAAIVHALAQQFPLVVTAEAKDNKAYIRVTGAIYEWNSSAEEITKKVDAFLAEGIKDVEVYLNGPGGDVFQAAEIENQIQRFTGKKTGTGGALIASAYTKIAASLDSFEQAENGMYMYHKPSGYFSGNEDKVESSLALLKILTNEYKTIYANKTGLTPEEIEANWSKGDVWLSAKDAAAQKFISGVIKKATITPDTKAMFTAIGSPSIPKVNNNKSLNIMDKARLCALLGLSADASEAQIEAAINANKEAATKVTALTKEKEADAKKALEEKVTALLNGAVTAKKITANQVDNLRSWAEADFNACENHIKALQPLGKISDAIAPGQKEVTAKKLSEMTTAEKDAFLADDPEAFKAAYLAELE